MTLDPNFLYLSPDSANPADVPMSAMIEEAERELAGRRKIYPDRIAHGRMTEQEASYQIAVVVSIVADLRMTQTRGPADRFAPDASFNWTDKCRLLRQEVFTRRATYPEWIDKGRLVATVAQKQMERIEALHWRYAVEGLFWLPENGTYDPRDEETLMTITRTRFRAAAPAYHAACAQRADTSTEPLRQEQAA